MGIPLLVTGFTAFGSFTANPAETIAREAASRLGARFEPLEVSYEAVEAFVEDLRADPPERWAMVGVHGKSDTLRLETLARNVTGEVLDVREELWRRGGGPIDPALTGSVPGNLHLLDAPLPAGCSYSDDAGSYLCNFVYYLARTRLPTTRAGFFHVAPPEKLDLETQIRAIVTLLSHE